MNLFISYLFTDPPLFFAVTVIVVFSVCAHEFSHAWTAMLCGDNTASDAGHLTFNPFRQMGVWSLITFAIFGLAWGRVPVNTGNFTKKWHAVVTALAGPLCNLLLTQVFSLLMLISVGVVDNDFAARMLFQAVVINYLLFLINILPLPGLDGYAVLKALLPRAPDSEMVRGALFMLIALLFVFFNTIAYFFQQIAYCEIEFLGRLIYG